MARQSRVTTYICVVDTNYLDELFGIPGKSSEARKKEVRQRMKAALETGSLLVVPIPCLFELANHISRVKDGGTRRKLAGQILESVRTSIDKSKPWLLKPEPTEDFPSLFLQAYEDFANQYASREVGLTDCYAVLEARRLKKEHHRRSAKVHIWTTDKNLKAEEPDAEEHPFLG
jgi:hypothetical protein